jgi:hypothetical protein
LCQLQTPACPQMTQACPPMSLACGMGMQNPGAIAPQAAAFTLGVHCSQVCTQGGMFCHGGGGPPIM